MRFVVLHPQKRHPQCEGHVLGCLITHHERWRQARPLGGGDPVQILRAHPSIGKGLVHDRKHVGKMFPCG